MFGLAEATLLVSAVPVTEAPVVGRFSAVALGRGEVESVTADASDVQPVVACGRLLPETEVAIVDPETRRRRTHRQVGEIWVRAPGVALGYWQRDDDSEATFRARIDGESNDRGYLRTGDLGFLCDGQLYVSARQKDLIIVHGQNHYPPDIEWTVQQAHPALRADNGAYWTGANFDGEHWDLQGELYPVECVERLCEIFRTGDLATVDIDACTIIHEATGRTYALKPLGEVRPVVDAGGIFEYARQVGMMPKAG